MQRMMQKKEMLREKDTAANQAASGDKQWHSLGLRSHSLQLRAPGANRGPCLCRRESGLFRIRAGEASSP